MLLLGGTFSGGWYEESEVNRDEKCETTLTKTIWEFLQGYFSHFHLTWLTFNVLKYVLLPKTYKQCILMMWSNYSISSKNSIFWPFMKFFVKFRHVLCSWRWLMDGGDNSRDYILDQYLPNIEIKMETSIKGSLAIFWVALILENKTYSW